MICTRCWQALWFKTLLKCEILRSLITLIFNITELSVCWTAYLGIGFFLRVPGLKEQIAAIHRWENKIKDNTNSSVCHRKPFSTHKALFKNEHHTCSIVSLLSVCYWGRETKFTARKLKISGNLAILSFPTIHRRYVLALPSSPWLGSAYITKRHTLFLEDGLPFPESPTDMIRYTLSWDIPAAGGSWVPTVNPGRSREVPPALAEVTLDAGFIWTSTYCFWLSQASSRPPVHRLLLYFLSQQAFGNQGKPAFPTACPQKWQLLPLAVHILLLCFWMSQQTFFKFYTWAES